MNTSEVEQSRTDARESEKPAAEAPVILKLTNASRTFENGAQKVAALGSIDLEVREGECVVFFGPSGCGKSTLLNLIAGFDHPTTGEILLEGKPVEKPGPDRLMMFQEHALFPWLNVIDNVLYGLRRQRKFRFRRRLRHVRARELLQMVHLDEFEKASVHELSGGMKQRAALARALAPDPKILLIDEPFPGLDALVRAKLYAELQEIMLRTHKTILSVTHDPNEAACLADRVFVFTGRPGKIKAEIRVDLPRPRDIADPKLAEFTSRIMSELEQGAKA
ncbi:MAG: nitrate/sulfonate/bicarbonate ABC transporter ATP-binding protein [Acidobacteria bacterium]|nr:MAG: nitrate/sulfonate/bicarbonate ABC transporter ATP-binding protein [Acidobacteriota bacterium]